MSNYSKSNALVLTNALDGRKEFVESLGFQNIYKVGTDQPYDYVISVGVGSFDKHRHLAKGKKTLHIEAGFLRSYLMDRSGSVLDTARCFFVDELGWHFDPFQPSQIENLLNTYEVSPSQQQRARDFIDMLVSHKITKYNDQSEFISLPEGHNVLVIEQAKNDQAVVKGGGDENSFKELLDAAIRENPDSNIIVKIHPDTLNGKRGGLENSYYGTLDNPRIHLIKEKVNPYTILEQVDKVYVFSSMFGIESLMAGKETHIFGMPCYAGWGLTNDRLQNPKRTRTRTLEELVYIIYFVYTKYIDDTPEDFVCNLLKIKEMYT